MSYDFTVYDGPRCPHCGRDGEQLSSWNYTCNVSDMWRLAIPDWDKFCADGAQTPLKDMLPQLVSGVHHMVSRPGVYLEMNPVNGWGDALGARETLEWLLNTAKKYPEGVLDVSR